MHLRAFTTLSVATFIFLFAEVAICQTDESLNAELNAAESAAPPPKELKSDGNTLDAVGIPAETATGPEATPPPAAPIAETPRVETPAVEPTPEAPPPAQAEEVAPAPETPEPAPVADKSEQNNQSDEKLCNCRFKPGTPYRTRRSAISGIFAIDGGTYAPTNYVSQVISSQTFGGTPDYGSLYGGSASPNFDLTFGAKYNFILGSVGLQLSGGYFSATNQTLSSTLSVTPITLGLVYSLDSLFPEPYVVPYFVGGFYTDFWKEVSQGLTISGRTSFAPFYAIGLNFQLDWLDVETHESGYKDFGLENTFLFVEARSFLSSNDIVDLSTGLQVSGGFKFEF